MATHPIGEVLGSHWSNSPNVQNATCPFKISSIHSSTDCRKVRVENPLSVCSHREEQPKSVEKFTCLCPYRFFDDRKFSFMDSIKNFHFGGNVNAVFIPEVSLNTTEGKRIGNIDGVMLALDENGQPDHSKPALIELQAVYVSGNIQNAFDWYLQNQSNISTLQYTGDNYPRPDFTSSHRKRLFPQLQYKFNALENAGKAPKFSVVCDKPFWDSLGEMPICRKVDADIHWVITEIRKKGDDTELVLHKEIYSKWRDIEQIRLMPTADLKKLSEDLKRKTVGKKATTLFI